MTATVKTAKDEIAQLVRDVWDAGAGGVVLYNSDVPHDIPDDGTSWARLTIRVSDGRQRSLAGDGNLALHERNGLATIQIFTALEAGTYNGGGDDLVELGLSCFERQRTPSGVWFKNVRPVDDGRDPEGREMFMQRVIAEFTFDQLR